MKDAGLDGLQTARLQLRRYTLADLDALDALNSDARVMEHLGGVTSRAETEQMLGGRILSYYEEHPGLGVWATLERASGACIGFHLLNHIRDTELIQVGYRLLPEHWGKGYATEMTVALLDYGYRVLGLENICGITALGNAGSQHVLTKSGLRYVGERSFSHPSYAKFGPLKYFERSASEWLAERRRD